MNRAVLFFALALASVSASAHLYHVQFAAIEESNGKLRVRYRMSADMFVSNLELEIKNGHIAPEIKRQSIDRMVAQYFEKHLRLKSDKTSIPAESISFTLDEKNGDWIADFLFPAPAFDPNVAAEIFCDAFLENNPRTQTLARVDWRGIKTVFHFRKDNETLRLQTAGQALLQETSLSEEPSSSRFLNGAAAALRSYEWLLAAALGFCVLRLVFSKRFVPLLILAFVLSPGMGFEQYLKNGSAGMLGFAAAWIAALLTLHKLIYDRLHFLKEDLA